MGEILLKINGNLNGTLQVNAVERIHFYVKI